MVGQIKRATSVQGEIDKSAEGGFRFLDSFRAVIDVKVEDDASPRSSRPREKCGSVFSDESHGSVDGLGVPFS